MRRLVPPTAAASAAVVQLVPQWAQGAVEIGWLVLLALGFVLYSLRLGNQIISELNNIRANWRRFKRARG